MFQIEAQFVVIVGLVLRILVITQNFAHGSTEEQDLIVQVCHGKLKGYVGASRCNRPYYGFKGIPYAKPPIGDLRFKAPVPPNPWKDVLDATKDGPICIQKNYLFDENPPVEGQEDCLYLNVYTPKLPTTVTVRGQVVQKRKSLLPVMVFIHYGAFFAGSGHSDYLGPEYFMDKDVVLVTFNYRLGVFGFLSTNDDAAPGNWAFKDQVAVLKWVQDNIGAFGGNNKKVTIFGQSAGAGSVHYHMLSPTTRNLFHRAISQSGSTLSLWARPQGVLQAQVAKQQAMFVGCNATASTEDMVDCLRKIDAKTLVESAGLFKFFSVEPFVLYGPVTEKATQSNPQPYITEEPLNLIKAGKFHRVPWIIGVVSDEGILRAAPLLRQPVIQNQLVGNFSTIAPAILAFSLSLPPTEIPTVWNKITDFFLMSDAVNVSKPETVQGFINLYTDRGFSYGSYQSALLHAWRGHTPIWFYHFGYRGSYTYGDHFASTKENIKFKWGVSHCDDLLYLFTSKRFFGPLKSKTDELVSDILIKLWTNFATYGNPTPPNEVVAPKWDPLPNLEGSPTVRNADLVYMNITGPYNDNEGSSVKLEVEHNFYPERMMFWENLPLDENIEGIE